MKSAGERVVYQIIEFKCSPNSIIKFAKFRLLLEFFETGIPICFPIGFLVHTVESHRQRDAPVKLSKSRAFTSLKI